MKQILALIIFLLCSYIFFGQQSFKVLDSQTAEAIPFATISDKCKSKFTLMSDKQGNFIIPDSIIKYCNEWTISCVGYESILNFVPAKLKTVLMARKTLELAPVTIGTNKKYYEVSIAGNTSRCSYGFNPDFLSVIYATYVPNSTGKSGYISSLDYFVSNHHTPDFNVPVRIRFYQYDTISRLPGKEISNINLIVYPKKTKWNTVDIDSISQHFPAEGIVVAYELINAGSDFIHSYKVKTNEEKRKQTRFYYGWNLGVSCCNDCGNIGFSFFGNTWYVNQNKWAPFVRLKIMYYQ